MELDPENAQDLKLFMEDGAEICSDEDLIEEIIDGKLLILAKSFQDYEKKGKMKSICL